jgi:hypothetical protein
VKQPGTGEGTNRGGAEVAEEIAEKEELVFHSLWMMSGMRYGVCSNWI